MDKENEKKEDKAAGSVQPQSEAKQGDAAAAPGLTYVKNANASGLGSLGRSEDDILANPTGPDEEDPGQS
ncbi:MAG TPA: hypothetical protein VFR58_01335 [Flavisolibacter sp.]|nr:hypothetical protein [Flavisolibacter sp.]